MIRLLNHMVNRPSHWIPIEKTFGDFVKESRGELVRELITNVNPKKNADYLFREPLVVAELKCLEKEAFTEAYAKKMQKLANDWMRRRLILAYGRVQLQLRKLPVQCQEEWLRLLELPIQNNIVAKANQQIRATSETLGLQNARGLLLLTSDGNYSLEPHTVVTLIGRILQKKQPDGRLQYSSISWLAYFSANMTVIVPGTANDQGLFFWMDGPRGEEDLQMQRFMEDMRKEWFAYRAKVTGTVPLDFPIENSQLEGVKFVKPVEPGKFYVDPSGRKYKCLGIEGEQIRWMLLDSWQQGHQIDAEFMQNSKYSGNYSPVLDSAEASRLERRYLSLVNQNK